MAKFEDGEVDPVRSRIMSAIRSKDTKPEMAVRRVAHALGHRFRLHAPDLPGKPDLVFRPRRKAVFVHGCFWHAHEGCRKSRLPATRTDFWAGKLARNRERDAAVLERLSAMGWDSLVIWECDTKTPEQIRSLLIDFLGQTPGTARQSTNNVDFEGTSERFATSSGHESSPALNARFPTLKGRVEEMPSKKRRDAAKARAAAAAGKEQAAASPQTAPATTKPAPAASSRKPAPRPASATKGSSKGSQAKKADAKPAAAASGDAAPADAVSSPAANTAKGGKPKPTGKSAATATASAKGGKGTTADAGGGKRPAAGAKGSTQPTAGAEAATDTTGGAKGNAAAASAGAKKGDARGKGGTKAGGSASKPKAAAPRLAAVPSSFVAEADASGEKVTLKTGGRTASVSLASFPSVASALMLMYPDDGPGLSEGSSLELVDTFSDRKARLTVGALADVARVIGDLVPEPRKPAPQVEEAPAEQPAQAEPAEAQPTEAEAAPPAGNTKRKRIRPSRAKPKAADAASSADTAQPEDSQAAPTVESAPAQTAGKGRNKKADVAAAAGSPPGKSPSAGRNSSKTPRAAPAGPEAVEEIPDWFAAMEETVDQGGGFQLHRTALALDPAKKRVVVGKRGKAKGVAGWGYEIVAKGKHVGWVIAEDPSTFILTGAPGMTTWTRHKMILGVVARVTAGVMPHLEAA